MNAPAHFEQSNELALAAAHLASLPRDRREALERPWNPTPYQIHPDRLAQLEREWSDPA